MRFLPGQFISIPTTIYIFISVLAISVFFISSTPVFAHGNGASFEKEIGNYSVDIGYDPEKLKSGLSERLDFGLSDKVSGSTVAFSDVWVRIEKDKNTIFASGIHNPKFGKAGLLYTFPEVGTYTVSARFEDNDKIIVETSFDLAVSGSPKTAQTSPFSQQFVWGVFGVVLGLLLSKLIKKHA